MTKNTIHFLIIILNTICLILILQVDFGLIPTFKCQISGERIQRINSLFSNISQGIIISTAFYFLLVFIPEYTKRKSLRRIIKARLGVIVEELQKTTLYIANKHGLKLDFAKLKEEEFTNIVKLSNELMNFNYEYQNNPDGSYTKFSTGEIRELDYLNREKIIVLKKIEEIFNQPNVTLEDEKLIELLCSLRDSWFYSGIESFSSDRFPGYRKIVIDFNKGVFNYFKIYQGLLQFYKPHRIRITKEN